MANNYKEIKTYDVTVGGLRHEAYIHVYTCQGMAADELRTYSRDDKFIADGTICYEGDAPENGAKLFRALEPYGHVVVTNWYLTIDEAFKAAAQMGLGHACDWQYGYLHTEEIEPLPDVFQVSFDLDEKGRPFCRVNSHPELNGKTVRNGKIFFPDRTFVGADYGSAMVSISKEFDTFGFLTGEMVKYEMPDMEEFLDWAWENADFNRVFTINHPGRGKYLAINHGGYHVRIESLVDVDGKRYFAPDYLSFDIVRNDMAQYLESNHSLTELYLASAWRCPVKDIDLAAIEAKFYKSETFVKCYNIWSDSDKYHSELIDHAYNLGLVSQYCIPEYHIEVVAFNPHSFNPHSMRELAAFSKEEVEELAVEVSKINRAADEAIYAKARKGKLKLRV